MRMSNANRTAELMNEVAPLVIHEMKQAKLTESFMNNESMRMEIIEVCLSIVTHKWDKLAVMVRTNPAFSREFLNMITA